MNRAHKIRLEPTNKQSSYLARASGTARFAYNWALALWIKEYDAGNKPSEQIIRKKLNEIKRTEFPWMLEVTKCAIQESIIDLGQAFNNFFKKRAKHPKFRKKYNDDRFRMSSGTFKVDGNKIRMPKIGWIKMSEEFRFPQGKLLSATVSLRAGQWYVSVAVELPDVELKHSSMIGIDFGVNEIVASDGRRWTAPRSFRASAKKLRRAQQSLARKKKGSNGRMRSRLRVSRIHNKIMNQRLDWQHKMTIELAKHVVAIEDLNVLGMIKNRKLSKSISDVGFAEIRRQLSYKTKIVTVDRWYPSSKLCSSCGTKNKHLTLSMRSWTCVSCGTNHDRDLNASINIANEASSALSAGGEFYSLRVRNNTNAQDPLRSRNQTSGLVYGLE